MINFTLNGVKETYSGNPDENLLKYLRRDKHITSVKDGCSGQATCGACTVEINGKAKLSCVTKMKTLEGAKIFTPEGFPEYVKDTIAKAFVNKGAVQCGFCTPGFLMTTVEFLEGNPNPTAEEAREAIDGNFCRCTGYENIVKAVQLAAKKMAAH